MDCKTHYLGAVAKEIQLLDQIAAAQREIDKCTAELVAVRNLDKRNKQTTVHKAQTN